jgi:hypothetical protein
MRPRIPLQPARQLNRHLLTRPRSPRFIVRRCRATRSDRRLKRRPVRILVKYTQIVESSRIPCNERQKYCLNPPVIDLGDQIIAESSQMAVPILDLLIKTKRFRLVAGQKRSIPAIFTRSQPTPRQFLAESSVCVYFTGILTSAQAHFQGCQIVYSREMNKNAYVYKISKYFNKRTYFRIQPRPALWRVDLGTGERGSVDSEGEKPPFGRRFSLQSPTYRLFHLHDPQPEHSGCLRSGLLAVF